MLSESEIKLIRTDTTLDLSQKAEKVSLRPAPCIHKYSVTELANLLVSPVGQKRTNKNLGKNRIEQKSAQGPPKTTNQNKNIPSKKNDTSVPTTH